MIFMGKSMVSDFPKPIHWFRHGPWTLAFKKHLCETSTNGEMILSHLCYPYSGDDIARNYPGSANQPDTLQKKRNSLLVNVDIPIDTKRLKD